MRPLDVPLNSVLVPPTPSVFCSIGDGLARGYAEPPGEPHHDPAHYGSRASAASFGPPRLRGKVAFVNGSGRGIGEAVVREMVHAGAYAILNVGTDPRPEGSDHGPHLAFAPGARRVRFDATSSEGMETLLSGLRRESKAIDILVNVSESCRAQPFLNLAEEEWSSQLAGALNGPALLTRLAAREMIDQGCGGRIINVAAPIEPCPRSRTGLVLQRTAQAGLIAFTRALAVELAPHDITVNAVVPGLLEIPSDSASDRSGVNPDRLERIPQGRCAQPQDVAAVVMFLASSDADYCTGARFVVDGGLSCSE